MKTYTLKVVVEPDEDTYGKPALVRFLSGPIERRRSNFGMHKGGSPPEHLR